MQNLYNDYETITADDQMLKSCFKHTISIYIIIIRDNCILVAIKVRLDCCKFIRRISYYWNNHQISSFQFQEFLESQLNPNLLRAQHLVIGRKRIEKRDFRDTG